MNTWRRITLLVLHLTILFAAAAIFSPHLMWWVKGGEYLSSEESIAAIAELETANTLVITEPENENRTKAMLRIKDACRNTAYPLLMVNTPLIIGVASLISIILVALPQSKRRLDNTED